MDPERLLALCHEHAGAERQGDTTRVLATMVPEPRYEFFPLRRTFAGSAITKRFYEEEYPRFAARVTGARMVAEWTNEIAAAQEYVIDVADDAGSSTTYHVLSMMPGDDATDLLTGERLYCDEGFVRALLGGLFDVLEPLP
jgi:hypothetical protein